MTKNLDNFRIRYVPSQYPSVINLPAESVSSHDALRRLGEYNAVSACSKAYLISGVNYVLQYIFWLVK